MQTPDRPCPPAAGPVVVVGAGPAGLTAAVRLRQAGVDVTVVEATDSVGGISRTVERDGWRFDLGGHRFFTKVPEVEAFWHEVLPDEDFLMRPRMSRILYRGKLFDYPLKPFNALFGLGVLEAVRCVLSYALVRVRPPKDQSHFEGWVAARFGWRLYRFFFKTYTEKVWGVPATDIQADWAAQRIKNLSLLNAVTSAFGLGRKDEQITTLIEEFQYPRLGPGMMWDRARDLVLADGGEIRMQAEVAAVRHSGGRAHTVVLTDGSVLPAAAVISSMPMPALVRAMDPPPPAAVLAAANGLSFRDFLTVALVVPVEAGFPDNWIYVHEPGVRVGRVQNFGSWSPELVKDGYTCLGLEYFVSQGDDLWEASDEDLIELGKREIAQLRLAGTEQVQAGYVVRVPKAYPVYDEGYAERVDVLRAWLAETVPNVHPVGRNGMHRYNNQDHSMLTAMLSVDNIVTGAQHDVWTVNVEEDYHETVQQPSAVLPADRPTTAGSRTGRDAPVLPRRQRDAA
ncbi:MAG: amine oxidase [Frankiales bacterium]|nr:amine oxidase [Frankiales bacterium]